MFFSKDCYVIYIFYNYSNNFTHSHGIIYIHDGLYSFWGDMFCYVSVVWPGLCCLCLHEDERQLLGFADHNNGFVEATDNCVS